MTYLVTWQELTDKLREIKSEFDKSFKCLKKTSLPSKAIQVKHLNILIHQHNQIAGLAKNYYPLLTTIHQTEFSDNFRTIKERLESIFLQQQIAVEIPKDISTYIKTFQETSDNPETKIIDIETPSTMT